MESVVDVDAMADPELQEAKMQGIRCGDMVKKESAGGVLDVHDQWPLSRHDGRTRWRGRHCVIMRHEGSRVQVEEVMIVSAVVDGACLQ